MSSQFVEALEGEIRELERALSGDVRFVRLTELRRVLDLYRNPDYANTNAVAEAGVRSEPTRARRRASPERDRIITATKEYLADKIEPIPTREIYEYLKALDIEVPGEVPQNNLSAMLSNSEEFVAQGRSGWILRDAIDDDVLYDVAETIVADLSSSELSDLQAELKKGEHIPSGIDARLLGVARARIHRDLSPSEKRALRSAFGRAVYDALSHGA